jgi:hypothetical protein
MNETRRIGIALDGSLVSVQALEFAFTHILQPGDSLIILTCLPGWKGTQSHIQTCSKKSIEYLNIYHHEDLKHPERQLQAREAVDDIKSWVSALSQEKQIHTSIRVLWGDKSTLANEVLSCSFITKIESQKLKFLMIGSPSKHFIQRYILFSYF